MDSYNLQRCIIEYFTLHKGDNLSDHSPVFFTLDLSIEHVPFQNRDFVIRPSWNCATRDSIQAYQSNLKEKLGNSAIPSKALHCSESTYTNHTPVINKYHNATVNACIQSEDVCIPCASLRSKSWLVRLSTILQGTIHILALLWMDNRQPRNGFIGHIMLKTKHECKQISRSIIRNKDKLSNERMARKTVTK